MMDVLPTDWSPKKTSLYFANGASDVFPAAAAAEGGRRVAAAADDDVIVLLLVVVLLLLLFELIAIEYVCGCVVWFGLVK